MIFADPPFAASVTCYPSSDKSFPITLIELIRVGRKADSSSPTNAVLFKTDRQVLVYLEMMEIGDDRRAGILGNSFAKLTAQAQAGDMIGFGNGDGDAVKFDAAAFMTRGAEFGTRCEGMLAK
jgi:hypothetical protein